jgi:hypothetical protein
MNALTLGELHQLPATVDLLTAARALGVGRTKAYELAKMGEFPCRIIRIGVAYLVPTAELLKLLGVDLPISKPSVVPCFFIGDDQYSSRQLCAARVSVSTNPGLSDPEVEKP